MMSEHKTLCCERSWLCSMRGFSLIELMIVVVIVAILAVIAYPSYTEHVRKSRRADAAVGLFNVAQQLERCFSQFNAYDNAACVIPASSPEGYYSIVAAPLAQAAFVLTATPVGPQAADAGKCATLTLNQAGVRGATGALGMDCW